MRILLFIENANEIQKQNHSRRVYWKRKPKQSALLWVDDDVACFAVWYVGCWHQVCDGAMPSIVNSFPANNEKIFLCSANCFFVMVFNFLKLIFSIKNISDQIASNKLNFLSDRCHLVDGASLSNCFFTTWIWLKCKKCHTLSLFFDWMIEFSVK